MAHELKLALFGLHRGSSTDPERLARRARRAEDVGFESLWVGDHIALPADAPDNPSREPRLEALVTLAHLAALTRRVRLAIGVIVLPQRQPVLLAKQLTSIDVLSGGRLVVGIGVGYLEAEFRALGVSLADRGARTDEYLAAMRALWDEPVPSFAGRFVSFAGSSSARGRFSGRIRRSWSAGTRRPLTAARSRPRTGGTDGSSGSRRPGGRWAICARRRLATSAPPRSELLEITITPPRMVDRDTARRYADLGVHRLAIQPATMEGSAIDELIETVGETLVGRV